MANKVAVVGAGLVGSGWAIVFARAGLDVAVYDNSQVSLDNASKIIATNLKDLKHFDLIDDYSEINTRISIEPLLKNAVEDVFYIQESVFETVDSKRDIFAQLDAVVTPEVIIGSSSSGIPASVFTDHVSCRSRALIAHPVNPPYLVPLVELVPAPWTNPEVVDQTYDFMKSIKQEPIRISREVEGFILNRLQGALLNEAWALFDEGYASIDDIDKTVAYGLGLRWSFMGPFETIDLNAPEGVADYARRLGPLYKAIAESRTDPKAWSRNLVARVEEERRGRLPAIDLQSRRAWRDRRLMALAAHKAHATRVID